MKEPVCANHPDRVGVAHYGPGSQYRFSLCYECFDRRMNTHEALAARAKERFSDVPQILDKLERLGEV